MKRFFFLLSAVVVSLTMVAQMQVWSNGTIIFSHDQTNVDSISFGSPMQVQANFNALSSASLAGCVFVSSLAGAGGTWGSSAGGGWTNALYGLFFLDSSIGYYGANKNGMPENNTNNFLRNFTYTIDGYDITLSMEGRTIHGKIIGKNGLVFSDFYKDSSNNLYPAVFITLNR